MNGHRCIILLLVALFLGKGRAMQKQKYDAIYARQSVDRADSISIESQVEYCKYETRGGKFQIFEDKGYSGKNVDRPMFQEMMAHIREGKISRVIVYKLDRISRSILDFATMMEEFQKFNVEFVSCTEKFDTSTPMGRAMLNICIVFAQLERETIQMRVTDAYISRSQKGFYMGGRIPYGYKVEPYMIDGKKTSRYVADQEEARIVNLIFSMYANPRTSYGDILRYLVDNNIPNKKSKNGEWDRCRLGTMIKNPIYVKADLDIYHFFKGQGAILHNGPEDFIGTNGCYLYTGNDEAPKTLCLKGQHIVLAPHEGIVPSDIWLKARLKCLNNKQVAKPFKAINSWLVGKVKCPICGYAMHVKKCKLKDRTRRYFICSRRYQTNRCDGVGAICADKLEEAVITEMKDRLKRFESLDETASQQDNVKITELTIRIEHASAEIEKLLDKISDADNVVMEYINKRIKELDIQIGEDQRKVEMLSISAEKNKCSRKELRNYMEHWEDLSFDDKRNALDKLIGVIKPTKESCEITWKI